jgi:c-di-GMP-binding flagellar brake protein YcgR
MRGDDQAESGTKDANATVRRHPRSLCSGPVNLRHLVTGEIQTTRGISLDISEGGLGALVQGGLRVGETVEMDFYLHERALRTVGIVRHSCSARSGFEFLGLTAEERLQIGNLIGHA